MKDETPLVSICCATYNHEPFIRDAIEGFLMQEVDFPIEILVNDDASTDGTPDILREYEQKHPDLINVVYQTENQYSKGVKPFAHLLPPRARGKYLALCEGDDYWTNAKKLAKQVAYLEKHRDCALVCGRFNKLMPDGEIHEVMRVPADTSSLTDEGFAFHLKDMTYSWIPQTLTVVFSNGSLKPEWYASYDETRDTHLFYHLVKKGYGYYMNEVFGVQRVHPGGVHSMRKGLVNNLAFYNVARELYAVNRDGYTRIEYAKACLQLYRFYQHEDRAGSTFARRIGLLVEAISASRGVRELKMLIASLLRPSTRERIRRLIAE